MSKTALPGTDPFAGGGTMGALMRAHDWSASPLGPPETWPQPLRTLVALMLGSRQPMFIAWGPERIMLYNDGYAPMCGQRHPAALGQPFAQVWYDIMEDVGPILNRAYAGEASHMDDIRFTMHRNGYPEETHFAFSFTPVRDETGHVAGMFATCTETTERILKQRALAKAQERLSHALDRAGMVGTFDWHIQTDILFSDARFAAMFSVDPEKGATGASIVEFLEGIHPDDRERVVTAFNQAVTTGEKYTQEYRLLQKDGTSRWIEARGECLYDEAGKPLRFPGVAVDITKRKQIEDALRKSEVRLQAVLRQLPVGVIIAEAPSGKVILSNEAVDRLLPQKFTPISKVADYRTHQGFQSSTGRELEPHDWPLLRSITTGEVVTNEEIEIERADGSRGTFEASSAPICDEQNRIVAGVVVFSDITERKRVEEVERRLAAIIESSDDAIVSKDLNGVITSWNKGAERLFGYCAEEVIGRPITILLPADRKDEEFGIVERIREGERVEPYETVRLRKDGSLVEVSLAVSPIRDVHGRIDGASNVARDITDRKRAERLQQVLMHELNHRVKNVLSVVQAIARQTFKGGQRDTMAREAFEARLLALSNTHDLLMREDWKGAELSKVVAEALAPYRRERFEIDGPSLRLPSRVALALALALHELSTNAAKYGALQVPAGRITITWRVQPGDRPQLVFRWQEHGGPPVTPPTQKGFGSRLIERSLAAELGGEVQITYDPAGVVCDLTAPLTDGMETDVGEAA